MFKKLIVPYHIYQTEGIILGKTESGEADAVFDVLTKDFGRINILGQGARYLKSKLRYNLKTFSHSRFGLVGGANVFDFWRLVDAEEMENFSDIYINSEKSDVVYRVSELLKRMLAGSYPDLALWKEARSIFSFLAKGGISGRENMETFELLAKLRLLSHLGYVEDHKKWLKLSLNEAGKIKPDMISAINKAFKESQL